MWTGMRTSKIVALSWENVDFKKRVIYVRETKTMADVVSKAEAKRVDSVRTVEILAPAYQALMDQRGYTLLQGKQVFHDPKKNKGFVGDQPIRRKYWMPAIKKAQVRYRKPYNTRHTYASMMLTAGEDHGWICGQLGHTDLTMLGKTYGRWITNAAKNSGNKAEKVFWTEETVGQI
jgi:integrase